MIAQQVSIAGRLRTLCVVGRVANLPTVGSNCVAGWLLGGGGRLSQLGWLCAGALLLYTGGMFLNDAVDADWDRRHRPERPIPAGRISRGTVCAGAFGMLAVGWLLLAALGWRAALMGLALVAAIGLYDLVHKRVGFAPVLMAGCRGLLYLTAAAAGIQGLTRPALVGALAMTGYVAGLSFVARHESTDGRMLRWPVCLLLAPVALAFVAGSREAWSANTLVAGAGFLLWTLWCLRDLLAKQPNVGRCISGLLAGIPLADGLAAAGGSWALTAMFGALVLFSRWWQRFAPAT